jgi:hypothetical protein
MAEAARMKAAMRKVLLVVLVPLLLSGCNVVTFGYNHADVILRHWANGWGSYNAQQREEIRRDVDQYLAWHRQYALPEYIAFLQNLQALLARDSALTPEDAAHVRAELARLYRLTMMPVARPAAHFLAALSNEQIAELRHNLEKNMRELRHDLLPNGTRENYRARAKEHVKLVERLVGNLSSRQEDEVAALSMRIPFATEEYLKGRAARQAQLLALLENRAGEEKIADFLTTSINAVEVFKPLPDEQANDAYDAALNEMMAKTYALLTVDQRRNLLDKIGDYLAAFQQLHQVGSATPALAH